MPRDIDIGYPTPSSEDELKRIRRALEVLIDEEVTSKDVQD
jgi:hypothetical protein